MRSLPVLVVLVAVAGCLAEPLPPPFASSNASTWLDVDRFPVELDHNHADPRLHHASLGLRAVAHSTTAHGRTPAAPLFNLDLANHLLVGSLGTFAPAGGALAPPMGLLVMDVRDVTEPRVLSVTHLPGGGVESVAITDDARYAFLGTEFSGAVGIWTIDLADPRAPKILTFTPQPTEGPHNIRYGQIGNRHFVFASVSHVATAASVTGQQDPLPLIDLRVDVFEFDPARPDLPMPLISSYQARDQDGKGPTNIVHDAILQTHPITGQPLLYVAHWDRGVRIVDLTDPSRPKEVGKYVEPAPTTFLTIHTVKPHPTLIEGRHVTIATAQCAYTPAATCHVRVLDTTDPTRPVQVGTWTLPDQVHGNIYTTEIFDLADGVLYVPWAHGGFWALDISTLQNLADPKILGYHFVDKATQPAGARVPYSNAVVIKDGHALLADVYTGLHVLALESPPPQPT